MPQYKAYTTTVVGAHSVPRWYEVLDRLVTLGQLSTGDFVDAQFRATQAAIVEQEAAGIDAAKLHVTFLRRTPAKSLIAKLDGMAAGADRFRCAGAEVYLHCPNGYGGTRLSNNALEKALGTQATTRNWNTVLKILK